jgi:hypothetical protein
MNNCKIADSIDNESSITTPIIEKRIKIHVFAGEFDFLFNENIIYI